MNKTIYVILSVLLIFIFSGCEDGPDLPVYKELRFNNLEPFQLDVEKVEVVQRYQPILGNPYVDHLFPVSISNSIKTWVNDRIAPKGSKRILKVIINDASVISSPLPKTSGLKSFITKDQAELFKAHLEVLFEVYEDDPLMPKHEMRIELTRSKSIEENATLSERQELFYQLNKELITDFNSQIEKNIVEYFSTLML